MKKNELFIDSHNDMDRFRMHFAKWIKPDPKGYMLYDSIYITL